MIPAITTLMFLTVLWLLGVVAVRIAAESGARIAAAVEGLPTAAERPSRRAAA